VGVAVEVDLLRLLRGGGLEKEGEKDRFDGVTEGIVTEIGDDAHLGRVRVRFPYITDGCQSGWARLSAPWAGRNRGAYFVPEVDDEVLIAFEHGDLRFPYVLGSLWSATEPPQEPDPRKNRRGLRSKSGHVMVFDDGEAHESVTLKSQGGQKVVLDDTPSGTKITIADAKDLFGIVIDVTNKKIAITSTGGEMTVDAAKVEIHGKTVSIVSDSKLELSAKASVTVNGKAISIGG
jgi:uncharacterized protein involved in type VI secretion and phage assembly